MFIFFLWLTHAQFDQCQDFWLPVMDYSTAGKFVAHALDRLAWIPRIMSKMFRARHAKVFEFKCKLAKLCGNTT